jgi:serine/threonine protein kinase
MPRKHCRIAATRRNHKTILSTSFSILPISAPVVVALQEVQPTAFGRYVLLDRLAEGGMAEVFRAILPGAEGFKRTFVIKRILSELSQTADFREMFIREARIGAMLNHPNIVQVYDFGNVEGHYFLAMEYLRGHDVLAIMKRLHDLKRQFPVPVAAFVAHEVASCLGYAHGLTDPDGRSLDIVHRDVSPSNVMCLREGGVKLLDFGIASALSEVKPEHTEQGTFRGKLAYMSPERLRNEPLDGRSDLYALGVMLWEILTRRRLFRGGSDAETFKNVMEMPVPPPSTHRPDVPPSLDAIVAKALARDPGSRYQTGQALADDLEEVMRETKLKSRMLPKLLVDLFGSGRHSSQVAMACVTPEMLAAAAGSENSTTGSVPQPAAATATSVWRSWRLWAGVAAIAVVIALALGLRPGRVDSRAAAPPGKTPAARAPAPPGVPATPPAVAPPVVPTESKKASRGKRSSRRHTQNPEHPIVRGLSIDPFAEAARRGNR